MYLCVLCVHIYLSLSLYIYICIYKNILLYISNDLLQSCSALDDSCSPPIPSNLQTAISNDCNAFQSTIRQNAIYLYHCHVQVP